MRYVPAERVIEASTAPCRHCRRKFRRLRVRQPTGEMLTVLARWDHSRIAWVIHFCPNKPQPAPTLQVAA